ncbi:MAG TPA: NADPH-dependent F420 reductase [Actinomycetota bacterium]|nr:NADPH-dependent F420 reductase [Actinomycetota bacterium]
MEVGIVGGTGDEGFGLALRLAKAGHHVTIGSRLLEKGEKAAANAKEILGADAPVDGVANETLAAIPVLDVLFVTVPYAGQADTFRGLSPHIPDGRIVCDCTSPLATAVGGRPWQVVRPWHGSAAEQAEALLGRGRTRLVSGFQTVSGDLLQEVDRPMDGVVLLCGADAEARATVGSLVEDIPSLQWADAGELSMARIIEPMTALLVQLNRTYKLKDTGIGLTGREAWGKPAPKGS